MSSYIGNQPTSGRFIELDSLTASATANYTLQLNSANFEPESVNNLLVSINGVIQGSSTMSLNGAVLTVGATLSSSDTIDFVRVFGNVGTVSTPTDGSVTANKIGTGAVVLTSKVSGVLPVANGGTGATSVVPNITVTADYVDTTSGTSIDFTIPAGVRRITALMRGVGLSGTAIAMFRLGTSSGIVTSGYRGVSSNDAGNSYSYSSYGEGFLIDTGNSADASDTRHGVFTLYLADDSGGIWVGAGNTCRGPDGQEFNNVSSGKVGLSAVCTTLRLTTSNGSDTFDGGSITILTE